MAGPAMLKSVGAGIFLCLALQSGWFPAWSQSPIWSRMAGSDEGDDGRGIAVDAEGDAYAIGYARGNVDGVRVSAAGDAFLVKFDRDGSKAWSRTLGSDSGACPRDVAVDARGGIYVVGEISGPRFSNHPVSHDRGFVAKYDHEGNRIWMRTLSGQGRYRPEAVAIGPGGGIYVGENRFEWNGSDVDPHPTLTLWKFGPGGDTLWSRKYGKQAEQAVYDVAVDGADNAYLLARTDGSVEGYSPIGDGDICLLKYDGKGGLRRTWQFGTTNSDFATSVAIDAKGNIFLAGGTLGRMEGDTSGGALHHFLLKLDPGFNRLWARFGHEETMWNSVALGAAGQAYVGGLARSGADGVPAGRTGFLLVSFDPDGNPMWSRVLGKRIASGFGGLAVGRDGFVFLEGDTDEKTGHRGDLYVRKLPPIPPSFDCDEAKSPQEKLICRSPALSALDDSISKSYTALLRNSENPGETKAQQRDWIKNRREACRDETGLAQCMRERLKALKGTMGP